MDIVNIRISIGDKHYFINAREEYHPTQKGIIGINTEGNETRSGELIALYNPDYYPKTEDGIASLVQFMIHSIARNLEHVIS